MSARTSSPLPAQSAGSIPSAGRLYRAVWRWHFYAGVLVAPLAIFLAITGAIYLWKPQYEAWRYRELLTVPTGAATVTPDAQIAAARAAVPPPMRAQSFQPAFAPGETSVVTFRAAGSSSFSPGLAVYVNPYTGEVVGQLREDTTFMTQVKNLHGSLFAGKTGKYIVELAASWALVLFLTGLYLAWPRPRFAVRGFLLPRLGAKGRIFWRDLHAVPAVWLSVATVFMLATGLLWTQGAGTWYRQISTWAGQGTPRESNASAHRSELGGWSPTLRAGLTEKIDRLASTPPAHDHSMHGGMPAPTPVTAPDGPYANAISLEAAIAHAHARRLPPPFVIGLPVGPEGVFSAISDRNQPFRRRYLHLDQYTGDVLADVGFKDFGYLAQFFSWGIVAHEGRLFGLANQILGSIVAGGVVLLGVSGLALWWQRRPERDGGVRERVATTASALMTRERLPRRIIAGYVALAALLPLLAGSLAVLWLGERVVQPWIRARQGDSQRVGSR